MPRRKSLQTIIRDLAIEFADGLAKAVENRIAVGQASPAPAKTGGRKRGGGRRAKDAPALDAAAAKLLSQIARSPGLSNEQLQKKTGLRAPLAKRALTKLRASGQVKTKGVRRGTTYLPA
jgi:hypothetical protein